MHAAQFPTRGRLAVDPHAVRAALGQRRILRLPLDGRGSQRRRTDQRDARGFAHARIVDRAQADLRPDAGGVAERERDPGSGLVRVLHEARRILASRRTTAHSGATLSARPSGSYLASLQAFRGLAAALVVFDHLHFHSEMRQGPGLLPAAFLYGHLGVDFFFVLSGFIIQHVHGADAGHRERAGDYAWRRFARIWPLLAALTTLKLVYMAVSGAGVRDEKFSPLVIATSYLCLPLPGWPETGWPVLDVAWTLRHEALFYTVFLVPIVFGARTWRWVASTWIALIAARLVLGVAAPEQRVPFPLDFVAHPLNLEFLLGIGVAIAVERWPARGGRAQIELLLGTALCALGVAGYAEIEGPLRDGLRIVLALGLALLIHASVELERAGALRLPRALAYVGDASYSLYLWHGFAIGALLALWPSLPAPLSDWPRGWLVLTFVVSFASSLAVYRWLEQPLTRLVRRLRPQARR
ncbi:MAG: acyltransferase [Planctomycetota bacterium]|nr:MAG: acyltransferase [Planctomycetota bacterium]